MAKLATLKPLISTQRPKIIAEMPARGAHIRPGRSNDEPYRKLYKTARWQKLRMSILVRDLFTCQMCGKLETNTSRLVCDHVEPHNGDPAAFWAGPFQTLCADPCHNTHKQKIERSYR